MESKLRFCVALVRGASSAGIPALGCVSFLGDAKPPRNIAVKKYDKHVGKAIHIVTPELPHLNPLAVMPEKSASEYA